MTTIKPLLRPAKRYMEGRFGIHIHLNPPHGLSFVRDIKRLIPTFKPTTILDVGANVGQSAMEFSRAFPGSFIHCLEPARENAHLLREATNDLDNVFVHNVAAGSETSTARLVHADDPSMHHLAKGTEDPSAFEDVDITTLDAFCESRAIEKISIMKVDTEGHELEVLSGAEKLLSNGLVEVIYLEAGMNPENDRHAHLSDILACLVGRGYRLFGIYEQMHEWTSNRPTLRRANLAFISTELANNATQEK